MATLQEWIGSHSRFWEETETVTHVSIRRNGSNITMVHGAKRHQVDEHEGAPSFGAYLAGDTVWRLPRSTVTYEPKPGDLIVQDDGTEWRVLPLTVKQLGASYRCTARNLRIAYDLRQLGELRRPQYAKDRSGRRVVEKWVPSKSGIPCRAQEQAVEEVEAFGKRGMVKSYDIYFAGPLEMTTEDQWRIDGDVYEILSYRDAERLDGLQVVSAQRRIAP